MQQEVVERQTVEKTIGYRRLHSQYFPDVCFATALGWHACVPFRTTILHMSSFNTSAIITLFLSHLPSAIATKQAVQ